MSAAHPLDQALADWLPEVDFGILGHGFAKHGRDYVLIIQANGTYRLTLTHVPECVYETRVGDDVWPRSWSDNFVDYEKWRSTGEQSGYVWGTNCSLAYPGLDLLHGDASAAAWSARLGKPMFAARVETDLFMLRLVFHTAFAERLSDDRSLLDQVLVPLGP